MLKYTKKMFADNFIKETDIKIVNTKSRPNGRKIRQVVLQCKNCNKHFIVDASNAIRTQQQCCSITCYRRLIEDFVGGNEAHPLYSRWLSRTQRCTNINNSNYKNYGARGISIHKDIASFKDFVKYVTQLPNYDESKLKFLSLDRSDNNGDYKKGNLRWTNRSTQTANQRPNSRGFNKYTGIGWSKSHKRWIARVHFIGKTYCSSVHLTEEAALDARNKTIIDNKLPHPIQMYYA